MLFSYLSHHWGIHIGVQTHHYKCENATSQRNLFFILFHAKKPVNVNVCV